MKKILSANQLKAIAVIAMTADHLAWTFFPDIPKFFSPCCSTF